MTTRIDQLEAALRKCIDTFDDLQRVLQLLGRGTLADACAIAADRSRDVLTPPETPRGAGGSAIAYEEFQRLTDDYQDALMTVAIRHERDRPDQEQADAMLSAVSAREALWNAIRGA